MRDQTAYDVEVDQMSEQAAGEVFDGIARRELGISGSEFLQRWDAGEGCCIKRSACPTWSTCSPGSQVVGVRMPGLLRFSKVPEESASHFGARRDALRLNATVTTPPP